MDTVRIRKDVIEEALRTLTPNELLLWLSWVISYINTNEYNIENDTVLLHDYPEGSGSLYLICKLSENELQEDIFCRNEETHKVYMKIIKAEVEELRKEKN